MKEQHYVDKGMFFLPGRKIYKMGTRMAYRTNIIIIVELKEIN